VGSGKVELEERGGLRRKEKRGDGREQEETEKAEEERKRFAKPISNCFLRTCIAPLSERTSLRERLGIARIV